MNIGQKDFEQDFKRLFVCFFIIFTYTIDIMNSFDDFLFVDQHWNLEKDNIWLNGLSSGISKWKQWRSFNRNGSQNKRLTQLAQEIYPWR